VRNRAVHVVGELERHIMRCRRRQEPASVLVARFAGPGRIAPARVLACFRMTDTVTVARTRDGWEVIGIFDDYDFDRDGFERRLRAALQGAGPTLGWARFPDDGLTLEHLLQRARAALRAPVAGDTRRLAGSLSPWTARGGE
jgi:hypothetical protein